MLPVVRRTWDDEDVPALRDDEELLELPRTWLEEEPLLTWLDDELPELRTWLDDEPVLPVVRRTWDDEELVVPALREADELLEPLRTWLEEEPLLTWFDDELPELRTCDEEDELEDVERRA